TCHRNRGMNPSGERGTSDIRGFMQQSHRQEEIPNKLLIGTLEIAYPKRGVMRPKGLIYKIHRPYAAFSASDYARGRNHTDRMIVRYSGRRVDRNGSKLGLRLCNVKSTLQLEEVQHCAGTPPLRNHTQAPA